MNQQMAPTGIILAAGQSSRFGADKLLHELTIANKRQLLIQHTLQLWCSVFDELCIVIRPDNLLLKEAIISWSDQQHEKINLIEAEQAMSGMGHSLKAAISATAGAGGWVIGLADMPLIPHAVLRQICESLQLGAGITAPYYDDQRGHPVGFNSVYKDELMALEGDTGAKNLLQREVDKIHKIMTIERGVLADVDSIDDMTVIERLGKV
jgi:molybdenum cofactor cytidylyltransferase